MRGSQTGVGRWRRKGRFSGSNSGRAMALGSGRTGSTPRGMMMPVPRLPLRRKMDGGFGSRGGRGGDGGTTSPRAAMTMRRRAADSAGRSRRNTARWRRRGSVGRASSLLPSGVRSLEKPIWGLFVCFANRSSPHKGRREGAPSPAISRSMATMRFRASLFRSIARVQSIDASVRAIISWVRRWGIKLSRNVGLRLTADIKPLKVLGKNCFE